MRDPDRFPLGTVSFCEPGLGADAGLPDTWVAGDGRWEPLELKRGSRGVVAELRPSQVRWHKTSLRLGIQTYGASLRACGGLVDMFRLGIEGKVLTEELIECIPVQDYNYDRIRNNMR